MKILGKIFGTPARVRIMRLFLMSKNKVFANKDVVSRSRVTFPSARAELRLLLSVGFIKKRPNNGYIFNQSFIYTKEFENLLIETDILNKDILINNFKKVGRIKLILVSGIFIKNKDSRVDVLIIGDDLKKSLIEESVHKMEAELGAEIVYAFFTSKDFLYRLNMYDKLIRDIIDFPHEVIFQAKDFSMQAIKKNLN